MSVPAVKQSALWLVKELTAAHVFESAQLAPYLSEFKTLHRDGDAVALAEFLVHSGLLTAYQAERVLAGEAGRLVLGPYLLADVIGSGSFGEVFQAVGRSDRKRYAVKVLPLRSLWNVRQAKAQLAAFAGLSHPAVVPFVDVDSAGGFHYLVWPFVEGVTFAHRVAEKGPPAIPVAAVLMAQAAEGLAVCHAAGIAHGLVSPSNLLIGPDGQVRILDLGVGAILSDNIADDESMLDTMSSAHATVGMLDCCAPETLNSPTLRDPAGDAYSFGCVFYFLLTGRLPFAEGNVVDRVLAHQMQPPPAPRDLNPAVPKWLDELVRKLMSKSPADRPASMADIVETLRAEVPDAFVELPATDPAAPTPPPAGKPSAQADTPHGGLESVETPWPAKPKVPSRIVGPVSASEIDFGDYSPPDESSEHDWASARHQRPEPLPPTPLPSLKPKPDRVGRNSSTIELPAPVTYTPTSSPNPGSASAGHSTPDVPSFARGWWYRLKTWLRLVRRQSSDLVQLSVFGPPQVSPGDSIKLQVFAHTPASFDSVNTLSRAFHRDSMLLATGFIDREVERGVNLGLQLKVTNAGVANSLLNLMWLGQPQPRAFDLHVPWESPAGMTPVTLGAAVNGEKSGEINFYLHILPRRG